MKLNKEQQIFVFEKAKEILPDDESGLYICKALIGALREFDIYLRRIDSRDITPHIPIFTRKNATIACKELGIKPPYHANCGGWWNYRDIETRLKVIDWMINKLKEEEH